MTLLGHSKGFIYDNLGNITEVTDENNHKTQYKYNLLGDIIQVTNALGHSTQYEYDPTRQLSKVEQSRMIDETLSEIRETDPDRLQGTDKPGSPKTLEIQTTTYERNQNGAVTAIHAPILGKEAHALWGYVNFWGTFVPHLLRSELPHTTA